MMVRAIGTALLAAAVLAPAAAAQALPRSALAVRTGDGWTTWWRSDRAPVHWRAGHPQLLAELHWEPVASGTELAELVLRGTAEAWRIRLVLVRIDPMHVDFGLRHATRDRATRGAWHVDSLDATSVLGVNAGQFTGGIPWGWVVRDGREIQPPGSGPLAMAFVVDSAGVPRLIPAAGIDVVRARGGNVVAFQSYPQLLDDSARVPAALRAVGRGVDVEHRDSRVALGILRDGRVLIALTRFEGLGGLLSELPFGPTIPEMAAIMGALGCQSAVALDGGISGQLAVRNQHGERRSWEGMRRVPLALEVSARSR